MSSAAKARVQALSEQLSKPREDPGMFEDIPKIPTIAGDSAGPYVVVISHVYHPIRSSSRRLGLNRPESS